MTHGSRFAGLLIAALLAAAFAAPGAQAEPKAKVCDRGDYKCLGQCAAWNNWCRPACGDWNGYCAGQSLPTIIGRMAPQSFFADPWYYGQPQDWNTGRKESSRVGKSKSHTKRAD